MTASPSRPPASVYVAGPFAMGYTEIYTFLIPLYGLSVGMNAGQIGMLVGGRSLLVAVLGVATPWMLGWGVGALLLPNASPLVHAFLGATLTATSVGITARVLQDLGRAQSPEARIILGAAVIDDVLGLVILAVVADAIMASNSPQGGTWQGMCETLSQNH